MQVRASGRLGPPRASAFALRARVTGKLSGQVPEEDVEEGDDGESWTRPSHRRDLNRERAKTEAGPVRSCEDPKNPALWQTMAAEMKAHFGAGPAGESSSSRGLAFRATRTKRTSPAIASMTACLLRGQMRTPPWRGARPGMRNARGALCDLRSCHVMARPRSLSKGLMPPVGGQGP